MILWCSGSILTTPVSLMSEYKENPKDVKPSLGAHCWVKLNVHTRSWSCANVIETKPSQKKSKTNFRACDTTTQGKAASHVTSEGQVAVVAKCSRPSQTAFIFVAMEALVERIYVDDLIAKRNVTAMSYPSVFDLSLPNQLADCESERSRVSSGLHSWEAEDEDEISPGPRWLFPSGWVPLLVSIFLNLLLPGFVPGFKLRKWPSTVILKGNSWTVARIGVCQDRSVGRIERSLFWSSKTRPDWWTP